MAFDFSMIGPLERFLIVTQAALQQVHQREPPKYLVAFGCIGNSSMRGQLSFAAMPQNVRCRNALDRLSLRDRFIIFGKLVALAIRHDDHARAD
jgi:hypothetical protein